MTEFILPWIVTFTGISLLVLGLKRRRTGWIGMPLVIVIGSGTLAAGISPLIENSAAHPLGALAKFRTLGVPGYGNSELPGAIGLVLLSYVTLAAGMLAVLVIRWLSKSKPTNLGARKSGNGAWYEVEHDGRLWFGSLALFGTGFMLHGYLMYGLFQVASIAEWASSRAVLTVER